MHIAFFDRTKTAQTPTYEIGMQYFQDGVADGLTMNFGDFAMLGKLASSRSAQRSIANKASGSARFLPYFAQESRARAMSMSQIANQPTDHDRYSRRLSDKIQAAFDHACDEGELQVASDLLETLEVVLLRVPPRPDRREAIVGPLMASHARLWHLRSGDGHASITDN